MCIHNTLSTQRTAGETTGYSAGNFAYGSTPYQTWRLLTTIPAVARALVLCMQPSQPSRPSQPSTQGGEAQGAGGGDAEGREAFVVWGSSLGWLVFYAALTYGVRSRGVELLPGPCLACDTYTCLSVSVSICMCIYIYTYIFMCSMYVYEHTSEGFQLSNDNERRVQ